jgi:AraC-like DNA-binding protein
MIYGDEYLAETDPGFMPDEASVEELGALFSKAVRISNFHESPENSFTHHLEATGLAGSLCFKLDSDRLIEINNSFLRKPAVLRNEVEDLLSFQFVSQVRRSEFLGEDRYLHELGPAIIVTAIPCQEVTYQLPKIQEPIRHVMLHTTLSNLMERMGEKKSDYPVWLQEILDGECETPRQRVLFLENVHRDLIWSCFHLPVSGSLLKHWLTGKFKELLCIGLQILKSDPSLVDMKPAERSLPQDEKIRRAMVILNQAYAQPPSLPDLAHQLGISETQLKSSFKSLVGTTVLQYCINKRINAAKLLLNENKQSISEISDIVGYQDHSAFTRAFRRITGSSPKQWRQSRSAQQITDSAQ